MTSVLIDTNIIIDVFGPETPFKGWSSQAILALKPDAQFILSPVVWSELAGMMASEDVLAVGAMKYAQAVGRRVPENLSVVGYNNSNLCLCTEPELTSVDNRLPAICERIVETMLGVLEGREMPEKTVFTAEIIQRGSTRAAQDK